jgi:hypothetical protein
MPVADALTAAVYLADKLARDIPRNIDAAALRYALHQLADAQRPAAKPVRKRRRRVVAPGYWAARKRAQRARARAAQTAAEEG